MSESTVTTAEVSDLLACTAGTAIKHMRTHGFSPVKERGAFRWRRSDVDTVVEERRRRQVLDAPPSDPAVYAWMDRGSHDAPPPADGEDPRDVVAERWGKPLDKGKIADHRAAMDRRRENNDTVVTREALAALTGAALPGRRQRKSMRDAAEDERRFRAAHPLPARAFRLPRGAPQSWRAAIYNVVVTSAFVCATDALREQILRAADCPFRLSPQLVSWAKAEYTARLRREVFAEEP